MCVTTSDVPETLLHPNSFALTSSTRTPSCSGLIAAASLFFPTTQMSFLLKALAWMWMNILLHHHHPNLLQHRQQHCLQLPVLHLMLISTQTCFHLMSSHTSNFPKTSQQPLPTTCSPNTIMEQNAVVPMFVNGWSSLTVTCSIPSLPQTAKAWISTWRVRLVGQLALMTLMAEALFAQSLVDLDCGWPSSCKRDCKRGQLFHQKQQHKVLFWCCLCQWLFGS